jgi:hypothetical protein
VEMSANGQRRGVLVDDGADAGMAVLPSTVAVRTFVKDQQINALAGDQRDPGQLFPLLPSAMFGGVPGDEPDSADAQTVENDDVGVEQVDAIGASHGGDIVMVAGHARHAGKALRECAPNAGDIAEAASLVGRWHGIEVARENNCGAVGRRQDVADRQLFKSLRDCDAEQGRF